MTALPTLRRRLLTLDEFHRMGEAGILKEDDRVELVEGEMIEMTPGGTRHAAMVDLLAGWFGRAVRDQAGVAVQRPIDLPPSSELAPDLALLRGHPGACALDAPARAGDVLLVIEVADSTLAYDRETKMPIYARHGIPEAWLVNVNAQSLTIFQDATESGYRRVLTPARDAAVSPTRLPHLTLHLSALR
jgi:Uma2 family endonuclease